MSSPLPSTGPDVPGSEHPLAVIRRQHGWSYQQLARVVAHRARDLGLANMAAERQKVWRWEHRGVTPDRVSQVALAAELNVPRHRLETHPWPGWLAAAIDHTHLTSTRGDREEADRRYAGTASAAEASRTAADVLVTGMRHLRAAYSTGNLAGVAAAARYMLAQAEAYEERLRALDGSGRHPAGPGCLPGPGGTPGDASYPELTALAG